MTRHRIATVVLLSSAAAFASPDHRPPSDDRAKPALIKLRSELFELGDKAKQQLARFRPLCDADGYPLVGNVRTKGDGDRVQPSELCTLVRETKAK